jgi:hypothetical protein
MQDDPSRADSPPEQAPPGSGQDGGAGTRPPPTPEEQMELYEKDLKENDWGHQPC